MKFTAQLASLLLTSLSAVEASHAHHRERDAAVAPTPASLMERSTETCDQWGEIETGSYIVYNDLWGEAEATSGSQCTTVSGLTNGIVSWSTSWTWAGGSTDVKSYANAALVFTPKTLASISSIPAVWEYT